MQGDVVNDAALSSVGIDGSQSGIALKVIAVARANVMAGACKPNYGFHRIAAEAFADSGYPQDSSIVQRSYLLHRVMPIAQSLQHGLETAVLSQLDFHTLKTGGFRMPVIEILHHVVKRMQSFGLNPSALGRRTVRKCDAVAGLFAEKARRKKAVRRKVVYAGAQRRFW